MRGGRRGWQRAARDRDFGEADVERSTGVHGGDVLQVRSLSAGYGNLVVLRDVSLEIGAGEIVAIVGPNGAGKTTLVQALVNGLARRSGEVYLGGRRLDTLSTREIVKEGLIVVPSGGQLFHHRTVEQNLLLGAYLPDRWRRRHTALGDVLAIFPEIEKFRHRKAQVLSGGQRQMVAIGRGLMSAPRVLVLDEPSMGLSTAAVDRLYEAIQQISEASHLGILLIEQEVHRAIDTASRAYILENGQIQYEERTEALKVSAEFIDKYLGLEIESK